VRPPKSNPVAGKSLNDSDAPQIGRALVGCLTRQYRHDVVRYFIASIVVVVLLSACQSDSAPQAVDRAQSNNVALAESPTSDSPLEAQLGFASEPERRRFLLISKQRSADIAMVECMEQAGFFYAVRSAEETFRSGTFVGDGSREWLLANGLGITSSFTDALVTNAARTSPDPATTNLDYGASLMPEQQAEYDKALVGDLSAEPEAAAQSPGCWEQSYLHVVTLLGVLDEFGPELSSLNSRLNADPRVLGFQQTWSTCMDAAGYAYVDEGALVDDVYTRLLGIELVDTNGVTQVVSGEALDALTTFERNAAVVSFDCRLGFVDELAQLRHDYEREFLDDNRFRIAELQESFG
jgi:hypothetical protein